ncbi:MAG: toxic anion resistance protein [Clostridia bacterium]|nr:toxic anion resistance protein [Clostridia bacterium]MBN2882923.1 toxic anion resistance protein [Clostridia bacterium]
MGKDSEVMVIGQDFSLENLSETEIVKAREIAGGIDITDSQAVIEFGVGAQSDIADFSDTVLDQVRSKDAGFAGEALNELMVNVKEIDVDGISGSNSKGLLKRVSRKIKKFIGKYNTLSVQIDSIVVKLEDTRDSLFRDIELLDQLYDKNGEYLKQLDVYIAAGEIKLRELNEVVLPALRKEAEDSDDPVKAQELRDMQAMINRFEKRVYDLKLSRMVSIQAMPQIRLVQNNDQVLVERIQSSILNTIPLWKNQIVIAITLFRQKSALKIQKDVTDTTNELLKKNSEMLKTGTIETAKEAERGIVEIETLRQVNTDLIETITESLRIQQEGKAARAAAEKELTVLEGELKQKLMEAQK